MISHRLPIRVVKYISSRLVPLFKQVLTTNPVVASLQPLKIRRKNAGLIIYWLLALSLLVFWVFTDYSDASLSLNDFALFANRFYRCSDLHFNTLLSQKSNRYYNICFRKYQALILIFYLSLHIILPLVRSYGDNSNVTLSPGRILI